MSILLFMAQLGYDCPWRMCILTQMIIRFDLPFVVSRINVSVVSDRSKTFTSLQSGLDLSGTGNLSVVTALKIVLRFSDQGYHWE